MCISFDKDYKRELVGIGVEDRYPILYSCLIISISNSFLDNLWNIP